MLHGHILTMLTVAALAAAGPPAQQKSAEPRELTQAEVELRVKDDVARRLRVRAADVRITEATARDWPDAGLGCNARRGMFESERIAGFEIVAEADGRRFVYHTDRRGRLLRCTAPRKPIDRIQ